MSAFWVLEKLYDYEGSVVLGLYATEQLAMRARDTFEGSADDYSITEFDVVEELPLKVGDKVHAGRAYQNGEILAIHNEQAWITFNGGRYGTWPLKSLAAA